MALAAEKTRCTDRNKAWAMFKRSTFYFRIGKRTDWVKAVYVALLDCKHASVSQRRWVAYRLALLHTRAGDCDFADQRWKQYVALARSLGSAPFKRKPCKPKR